MTAIGATFAICGWIILKLAEATGKLPFWWVGFGVGSFCGGLTLGLVGIVVKLWEIMP